MEYISYEDFKKMDMRIGEIKKAKAVPETNKLLCCEIDFGEDNLRQVVSGIAEYYPDPEVLVGKKVLYILNLEPRTIKGVESNGMLMAVGDDKPIFLIPEEEVKNGSKVR